MQNAINQIQRKIEAIKMIPEVTGKELNRKMVTKLETLEEVLEILLACNE